jgi:hypothetical protein
MFHPIILLNTIGKLFEKMLAQRMQFDAVRLGIFHSNQLGGIKQCSTEDMGIFLTHLICTGWMKGLKTSIVAFDIAQFFPSLSHSLLVDILKRQGFPGEVVKFFSSYLKDRSTQFLWNSLLSPLFDATVGVEQGSAISPMLSALYITPVMHGFSARTQHLGCVILLYVDDGTIIVQSKSLSDNLVPLKEVYWTINNILHAFGLVLEHDKSEIFHFMRTRRDVPPPLALSDDILLTLKLYWHYLGFFFNKTLSFKEHIRFYSTKAFFTVLAMRMLGNFNQGLSPSQK